MQPGTQLGHYEILEAIGKGGMGEVWRAKDTKLGRDVAIKTLPREFAQDEERLARFKREAKLLASLNHPNVAAIHGFEQDQGTHFLVMELVEGDTLADQIKRAAIPVEDSLKLALQIAEALEAAHEKGVIHRDLKPANIKVTPDGKVKVLDFGLAKAFSGDENDFNLSNSPTQSIAATQQGIILGTAAYMSPEQAQGQEVDRRTDIWALGCVLFEMLTGRAAFAGDNVSLTLARILERQPEFDSLPANLQPRIGEILERCLEKQASNRWQAVGDVRVDIQKVLADPSGVTVEPLNPVVQAAAPSSLPWVVTALVTLAAIVLAVGLWQASQPEDRPLVRLDVDLGQGVDLGAVGVARVVITPDGTRIAYAARASGGPSRLYTRRLDQATAIELAGTEGASAPFFSPDGEWIGFVRQGTLSKISVEGGAVVPLGELQTASGGAAWGEDGTIVISQLLAGLQTIHEDGGDFTTLVPLDAGELMLTQPQFLPGGAGILFATHTALAAGAALGNVEVFAEGARTILVRGATTPAYLPSGHLVYNSGGVLFATRFDPETLEISGSRVPVLDDLGTNPGLGTVAFALSRDGTLVYRNLDAASEAASRRTVEWIDRDGNRTPLIETPDVYNAARLSPDGGQVVVLTGVGGSHVEVYDPVRDDFTRLTFDDGVYTGAVWTPDAESVIFGSVGGGIYQARVDGAGPPAPLLETAGLTDPTSFGPDLRLAYGELRESFDIYTVALDEDDAGRLSAGEPEPFLATTFGEAGPQFSPDGRWIAYASNESGRTEVSVREFVPSGSGEGARVGISNSGGSLLRWSPDTQELFYSGPDDEIMVVDWRVEGDRFVADRPRVWAEDPGGTFEDIGPGGRALIIFPVEVDDAPEPDEGDTVPESEHHVVFMLNFFDYVEREVPLP